ATGRRPRQRVALTVGNRDDRVVEGRVDMRDPFGHVLLDLLARARRRGFLRRLCHRRSWLSLRHGRLVERDLAAHLRTLTRPRVRTCALTANWQTLAMPDAAVAAEVHQPLDAHCHLAAEVALHGELGDAFA